MEENKVPITVSKFLLSAIIFVSIVFSIFGTIGAGERGVKLRFGRVVSVLDEGVYTKLPIVESVYNVNVKTHTIQFDTPVGQDVKNGNDRTRTELNVLGAASKDLQDVSLSVIVNYHQDPSKVGDIYQKFGSNYQNNVLEPIIRETVKSVSARYTAEELVTKRTQFSEETAKELTSLFESRDSILERFSVANLEFSDSFNQAIEKKVTAEQDALAAKNKLEQIKFEAEQQVEKSRGQAESTKIEAQGKADALRIESEALSENPKIVELRKIEKWDGKMPEYFGGNATPLVTIP